MRLFIDIILALLGLAIVICAVLVFKAGISRLRAPLRNEKLHIHGIPVPLPSHSRFNGCLFIASGGFLLVLIIVIVISVLFSSCNNNQDTQSQSTQSQKLSDIDSVVTNIVSLAIKKNIIRTIVTDRFYRIVKAIDSAGYYADSTKYKYSYLYPDSAIVHVVDKDIFYDIPVNQSMPNDFYKHQRYHFNPEDYQKYQSAIRIVCFHFIRNKEIEELAGDGWFPDGVAEEWTFPDSVSARIATEDYYQKCGLIIFNSGAYVCSIDNYMYVFYSRAAIYTGYVKPFFEKFLSENNATVPKISPNPFLGLVP